MGIFDFLNKRKDPNLIKRTSSSFSKEGIAVTTSVELRWVDDVEYDESYEKFTTRDVNKYNAKVKSPCGFDFSEIRRWKGCSDTWWLEGGNFEKAINGLRSIMVFEDEIREKCSDFPKAIDYVISRSIPFKPGEDGNLVPLITMSETKSRGLCAEVSFHVCTSSKTPLGNANLFFAEDGSVKEANVTYSVKKGDPVWRYSVAYRKKTSRLTVTTASKDYIELFDEKKIEKQKSEMKALDDKLSRISTVESMCRLASGALDLADEIGIYTKNARKAVGDSRFWKRTVERDGPYMKLRCVGKIAGELMVFTSDGDFGRMRYWSEKGAPDFEFESAKGSIVFAKANGERIV